MPAIVDMTERWDSYSNDPAIVWEGATTTYGGLRHLVDRAGRWLEEAGIGRGTVCVLDGDFGPAAIALEFALIARACVVVPQARGVTSDRSVLRDACQVEIELTASGNESWTACRTGVSADHELYQALRARGAPGLVLLSSGTSGAQKAALHDFGGLLERYRKPPRQRRMLGFLLFDHIGGVNTMLACLAGGGCLVGVPDRAPDAVASTIERERVEVLPTSPTFLNLLLLAGAIQRYDLSSLRLVTYGTEPMPEQTLARIRSSLPEADLRQTYGLSEVGIMRSQSRTPSSLWMRIGGDGFETRVRDGMLEIKAQSAMLGYLNASSPFTSDGWFKTLDEVRVDGEWVRVLGRRSEVINVGGQKVHPSEVEDFLLGMEGVEDAVVRGEKNELTGELVAATVRLSTGESDGEFRRRMRAYGRDRVEPHKVPQRVRVTTRDLHSSRYKRVRVLDE
jgi:long-chain acyl-CoA synthetase